MCIYVYNEHNIHYVHIERTKKKQHYKHMYTIYTNSTWHNLVIKIFYFNTLFTQREPQVHRAN